MRLLLDTHFVVWAMAASGRPRHARRMMVELRHDRSISVASIWEIALKLARGKLVLGRPLIEAVEELTIAGARLLPLTLEHAAHMLSDAPPTSDPFDRMLLAQCDVEGMRLLTVDGALAGHRLAARA